MSGLIALATSGIRAKLRYFLLLAAAAIVCLIAAGYALSALHGLAAEEYGAVNADLAFSAAFLLAALATGFAALAMGRRERRRAETQRALSDLVHAPKPLTVRRLRPALRAGTIGGLVFVGVAAGRLALRRALGRG